MIAGKVWGTTELVERNGVLEFHRIETKAGGVCSKHMHEYKWNGWSMPMVELDQIKKFNEIQKKTLDSEPTSIFKIIDEDSIQIKMFDEDDWIGIEAEYIDVNGQTKKVFDISLGWTWSEEDL